MCVVGCVCQSKIAVLCVCSLSSQEKAEYQREIKTYEEVSDECSSGMMRVVHLAHSIPGVGSLCVGDSYISE